jgi:hypothetical protein
MSAKALRARVVAQARRDAVAYVREFRRGFGFDQSGLDWVRDAWADLKQDFKLDADNADALWPPYWEAFYWETLRLSTPPGAES